MVCPVEWTGTVSMTTWATPLYGALKGRMLEVVRTERRPRNAQGEPRAVRDGPRAEALAQEPEREDRI